MQMGESPHWRTQGTHAPLGFFHTKGGRGHADFSGGLAPLLTHGGLHSDLFNSLHDARESLELALGLLRVLPGNIFLDVFHFLEKFFLLTLKDFLSAFDAFF